RIVRGGRIRGPMACPGKGQEGEQLCYLPYFAFAAVWQESLAAPESASHFSIATLYSACILSSRASWRTAATFCVALASAIAFVSAAFASLMQTSLSLPFLSSHFSLATS